MVDRQFRTTMAECGDGFWKAQENRLGEFERKWYRDVENPPPILPTLVPDYSSGGDLTECLEKPSYSVWATCGHIFT